eukprot:TRINITY_DN14336_c0_g1_i2.p1 TRINITY_DN14336_c0_g1~~TRINITY_DN14336_c0_g1_i2.p1  ORF type:complete len:224 (-),score=43.54 TRINITY_DN14336_c0_g1_i2:225-896(-)
MPAIAMRKSQGLVGDQEFMAKLANLKSKNQQESKGLMMPTKKSVVEKNYQPAKMSNSKGPGVPDTRSPSKKSLDAASARQYPKSPLTTLLRKGQVKTNEVNRLLVTVNVLGSAGPLRFLASSDDTVQKIIEVVLKSYAREGRLPVLGQNIKQFELYCANGGYEALDPSVNVGSLGTRNFLLCKKQQSKIDEEKELTGSNHHAKNCLFMNWFNNMGMGFGISSH